jgi:aminoglycoside 3-N-acetyltransferase
MAFRDTLRSLTPEFILIFFRNHKRKQTRQFIDNQLKNGDVLTQIDLESQLKTLGIKAGDDVLVHCAFSKLGAVAGGPQTFIDALKNVIGEKGNLLMPSSPNASFQLDYIQNLQLFDVDNDVSKMGAVSEVFRKNDRVFRSAHPTEPVCVWGKEAIWYTEGHEKDGTAYGPNSPFKKLADKGGKILYIGVTLDNAGTSLHTLEDAVADFKFPVYYPETFIVKVNKGGEAFEIQTKVHNPEQSKKRRCDELIPLFEEKKVAVKMKFAATEVWVFDARKMLEVMIKAYEQHGITMYTPKGS